MIRERSSATKSARKVARDSARQAVIDIGSNSVRLVIYDGPRRAPMPICNEKALCGLGRDMTAGGGLNPAAAEYALATLRRFSSLIDQHGRPPTRVIATAAVREAKDGAAFIAEIKRLGFAAEIIDGAEEARLAALGVVSCEPEASGLVGDMGGGSLELIGLDRGAVGSAASLSLGALRLMQASAGKIADAPMLIEAALDAIPWLNSGGFSTLYSVGGAWRALARIHMRIRSYPLSVLHNYEFSKAEAIEICDLVAKQSRRSLLEIPGLPHRRIDTLPFASLVFKSVLKRCGAERVVTSAAGVREGLLYDTLTTEEKALDPLFEGARFFAARLSPEPDFGDAVAKLTSGLFPQETAGERRIRLATSMLADIGAYFHPDHRGKQAYETALHGPFYALTHRERVAIAVSLFCRHAGKPPPDDEILGLLSPEERVRANRLGLAMRFCAALAPKAPAALASCSLFLSDGKLVFSAPREREPLMGELPRKRLSALAQAFEASAAETYF